MKIAKLFDGKKSELSTQQELLTLLKSYKGILSSSMIDYLNSLIELEFSVIRDYIKEKDRKALSELEIYKRVAIYNIYNRAINIFKSSTDEISITGEELKRLKAYVSQDRIEVFEFKYGNVSLGYNERIPDGYKTMEIGTITLYQKLESEKLREEELNRIMSELERLYDERNPYIYTTRPGVVGGPASTWAFDHAKKIERYEKRFTELDSKKELSEAEKRKIEITNKYYNLLLEDYGLTSDSFKERKDDIFISFDEDKSNLDKTLVKEMPNLTIENEIEYL